MISTRTDPGPFDHRERRATDALDEWLLLDLNRWALTAAILGLLFAVVVVLGALDPVPLRVAVRRSDPVETLFQALLTAIVTGVTLVVTINQLVLSQELGAVGDRRERMEGATAFRRDAAAATGSTARGSGASTSCAPRSRSTTARGSTRPVACAARTTSTRRRQTPSRTWRRRSPCSVRRASTSRRSTASGS